jgi:hypothetical protein
MVNFLIFFFEIDKKKSIFILDELITLKFFKG